MALFLEASGIIECGGSYKKLTQLNCLLNNEICIEMISKSTELSVHLENLALTIVISKIVSRSSQK